MKERIILGIDPGTNFMGYGIISIIGKKVKVIVAGSVSLGKLKDPYAKLKTIFDRTTSIIKQYSPTEFAIESQFYGNNVQSMLKLGRAQGVAITAALNFDLKINEYAPKKIKVAVTGSGAASKEQVANILQKIMNFNPTSNFDATDALAIALCHYYQSDKPQLEKSYSSWGDFIKKNPNRIG